MIIFQQKNKRGEELLLIYVGGICASEAQSEREMERSKGRDGITHPNPHPHPRSLRTAWLYTNGAHDPPFFWACRDTKAMSYESALNTSSQASFMSSVKLSPRHSFTEKMSALPMDG